MLYKGSCNTLRIYTECLAYLLKYILIDYLYKIHGFKKKKKNGIRNITNTTLLKYFENASAFPYIFFIKVFGEVQGKQDGKQQAIAIHA